MKKSNLFIAAIVVSAAFTGCKDDDNECVSLGSNPVTVIEGKIDSRMSDPTSNVKTVKLVKPALITGGNFASSEFVNGGFKP